MPNFIQQEFLLLFICIHINLNISISGEAAQFIYLELSNTWQGRHVYTDTVKHVIQNC